MLTKFVSVDKLDQYYSTIFIKLWRFRGTLYDLFLLFFSLFCMDSGHYPTNVSGC